jgi:hypothetical protein
MKYQLDSTILSFLPMPLVQTLEAFEKENHEKQAFRSVHRLIDAIEVLCKLYTVASVCSFLEVLKLELNNEHNLSEQDFDKIKVMLAAGLKTPSLGIWWSFARDTAKVLTNLKQTEILPHFNEELIYKNSLLKKAFDSEDNLITFRNKYAHGATPSEEVCGEELAEKWPKIEKLLGQIKALNVVELVICKTDGKSYLAKGDKLELLNIDKKLKQGDVYFHFQTQWVNLHPLLTFNEKTDGSVDFYFYNDLKDKHANFINYPHSVHQQDSKLKEELLARIPIHEWKKKSDGEEFRSFKEHIEMLTEVFKGRKEELKHVSEFLETNEKGFYCIWGSPGVGKSALLARVSQLLSYAPEIRQQAELEVTWPNLKISTVEYFIRRGSTETITDVFESLSQRLDFQFGIKMELGKTNEERRILFEKRLSIISKQLKEDERLLLLIDGLDEAKAGDPMLTYLPKFVPEKILILYSARPQPAIKFSFYDSLDREHRSQFELGALSLADIRAILMEHVNKYELTPIYIEDVLKQSDGNPLYLKFLCKGLEQKIYRLNQSTELPNGMKELYEKALYKMETEFSGTINYLNLLAASHDFVSKEMAADLFGMKPSEFEQRILAGCSELLYENSITTSVEDYQLFHESLREYLKEKYNSEISEWNEKIADYCKDWQEENKNLKLQKAALRYAMSFATTHLYDSWLENKEDKPALAAERKESLLALIDNQEWRYKNFEVLGNAKALQQAYQLAQKVIVAYDKEGEQISKVIAYANAIHHEPFVMYLHQRKRLQKAIPSADLPKQLETLIDLANMGESATTKLMLLYTALWSSDFKGVRLPTSFTTKTEEWLELARDNSLKKMWGFVQQKTKI